MKYQILDTVMLPRSRYELIQDSNKLFSVIKIVGKKIKFLYTNKDYETAMSYYEREIGAF